MSFIDDIVDKIKGLKHAEKPAEKPQAPPKPHPVVKTGPETEKVHGIEFHHSSDDPKNVWFNELEKAVYIDNPEEYVEHGGKLENRPITSAMDPHIYRVYSAYGQERDLRYYKPEHTLVSVSGDPFARALEAEKIQKMDEKYKYKVIAAYQRMTGKDVFGSQFEEVIMPDLKRKGMTTEELIAKYGKPGD